MDSSSLLQSIKAQFHVVMGSARQVSSDCRELQQLFGSPLGASDIHILEELVPLLTMRSGDIAAALFEVFEKAVAAIP